MNAKIDTSIFEVDKFIRRLHDLELVFKAPSLEHDEIDRVLFSTISTKISESILAYQTAESSSPTKTDKARICLYYINIALTRGFIDESESTLVKVRRLENELDECNKRCEVLAKENKRLHKLFGNKSFVGDVNDE